MSFENNNNNNVIIEKKVDDEISIFDKIQFTLLNTIHKIKYQIINEEKIFVPELIETEKLNKKKPLNSKNIIVPPITLEIKNNKTFTKSSNIIKNNENVEKKNNNNNIKETNYIKDNNNENNDKNNNDNNKENIIENKENIIDNQEKKDNNNTNTNLQSISSQKFTKNEINISENISDSDYLLLPSSPLINILEKKINLTFTKSSLVSFYNSLFSLPNFSQFYNNSNLTISIRSEGTSLSSSFPLIKTLYKLSKTELKSGTNCYDLMQYMYNVDLRKYWDGVIKKFDVYEGNGKNFLVSTWGNSPMFLISERDSIEKRFMFEYECENEKKYFLFSSSVDEDLFDKKEDVIRIFNPINFLMLFEDENNFYFYNLTQSDFKMNLPQIILNVTLPITSLNWYKNLKKFSFDVEKINGEYVVKNKKDENDD